MSDDRRGSDWVEAPGEDLLLEGSVSPQTAISRMSWWAWLGSAFVLPMASASFYREGIRRGVGRAITFFIVLGLTVAVLMATRMTRTMGAVDDDILAAYGSGEIPTIILDRGMASVEGPEPAVLYAADRTFLAVDTTGIITEIDRGAYDQGVLLTRDELHYLDSGGDYRILPLAQVLELAGTERLVLDAEGVVEMWQRLRRVVLGLAGIGFALWYSLGRLAGLALMTLVLWAVAAMLRHGTRFSAVFIVGLYASGPTLYLNYLLSRTGINFLGRDTLLLLAVSALVLALIGTERGRRLAARLAQVRPALAFLGVPFLIFLVLDVINQWSGAAPWLWLTALATIAALLLMSRMVAGKTTAQSNPEV